MKYNVGDRFYTIKRIGDREHVLLEHTIRQYSVQGNGQGEVVVYNSVFQEDQIFATAEDAKEALVNRLQSEHNEEMRAVKQNLHIQDVSQISDELYTMEDDLPE